MKSGRKLGELAAELERQARSKKDYVADTRKLSLVVDPDANGNVPDSVTLAGVNGGMKLRPAAHAQLAQTLGIPKQYYDRMLEYAPDLVCANVNAWMSRQPSRRLIRTLDDRVRAILSESYRPLDNFDLAEAVLPKLLEVGARVESAEITDTRLYIKAVTDRISGTVKVGDPIQAGVLVSNSEIGSGAIAIKALDFRLVCLNGIVREVGIRKAHLGRGSRGQDVIEEAREYFKDETRQLDDRAFWAKVADATGAMFDAARFEQRLDTYRAASERQITADPTEVMEVVCKKFDVNEDERKSVLLHLIKGGDLSQWGLANAVTRAAQDVASYDRSTELERLGGMVVELPQKQWADIAQLV